MENSYIVQVERKPYKNYDTHSVVSATYEDINQFWPYTDESGFALPKLAELRGTKAVKSINI